MGPNKPWALPCLMAGNICLWPGLKKWSNCEERPSFSSLAVVILLVIKDVLGAVKTNSGNSRSYEIGLGEQLIKM